MNSKLLVVLLAVNIAVFIIAKGIFKFPAPGYETRNVGFQTDWSIVGPVMIGIGLISLVVLLASSKKP